MDLMMQKNSQGKIVHTAVLTQEQAQLWNEKSSLWRTSFRILATKLARRADARAVTLTDHVGTILDSWDLSTNDELKEARRLEKPVAKSTGKASPAPKNDRSSARRSDAVRAALSKWR